MANNKSTHKEKDLLTLFGRKLKTYFFTGILVAAPVGLTIYIAWSVVDFIDQRVGVAIPRLGYDDYGMPMRIPGLGLIVLLVGLTLIGAITKHIFGKMVVRVSDKIMARMPILSGIYSLLKQIVEMLVGDKKTAYRQVVLVPYPDDKSWVLGFVTSTANPPVDKAAGEESIAVFVPLTPNPTAGFLLYYPKSRVKNLTISVEEGWKLILSTGIALPEAKKTA